MPILFSLKNNNKKIRMSFATILLSTLRVKIRTAECLKFHSESVTLKLPVSPYDVMWPTAPKT